MLLKLSTNVAKKFEIPRVYITALNEYACNGAMGPCDNYLGTIWEDPAVIIRRIINLFPWKYYVMKCLICLFRFCIYPRPLLEVSSTRKVAPSDLWILSPVAGFFFSLATNLPMCGRHWNLLDPSRHFLTGVKTNHLSMLSHKYALISEQAIKQTKRAITWMPEVWRGICAALSIHNEKPWLEKPFC